MFIIGAIPDKLLEVKVVKKVMAKKKKGKKC